LSPSLDKSGEPILALGNDALSLTLAPGVGGAIAGFSCRGRPVLRPAIGEGRYADQLACFPLVPFSNRVRDGSFAYGGRILHLPRNHFDPHPLHGDGWQARWQIAEAAAARASLTYEHAGAAGWPWRYRAEQRFVLDARGLAVSLRLSNLADEPFPAGLGFHPYFPRAGARLRTQLRMVWLADEAKLPTEPVPVPPEWDFSQSLPVDGLDLDHCFTGWCGEAVIDWPYGSCRLTAPPPLDKLVIYVPPGQDFFCVEPVSHVNDGFNLRARGVADTGIRDLVPGEALAVEMSIALESPW
jgi:aldose 1-epimerase